MKNNNSQYFRVLLRFLLMLTFSVRAFAQSVEVGYVKEYNGTASKTPLSGVELSVKGAPSTVSGEDGSYELHFAVLKPGETVDYNDIYKSGYVIFNKDALKYWRISNSKKYFVIVMCKESAFRELKKKYYNIFDQSYKKDYEHQLAEINKKYKDDLISVEREKAEVEKRYKEKLSDINNYVELFARIDENEMDEKTALAIRYINEGNIVKGIEVYEELNLQRQVQMQLEKLRSGEKLVDIGQQMINNSVEDLLNLVNKLKQQIGFYNMGGSSYDKKRASTAESIILIYQKLNAITPNKYNEELGRWLCFLERYAEAAALPSRIGLYYHSIRYQVQVVKERTYLDSLRCFYTNAMNNPNASDSLKIYCEEQLKKIPDFGHRIENGDTIYVKILNNHTAAIYPLTPYCYNRVNSAVLKLPEKIRHNNKTYKIIGLAYDAFRNNINLRHVELPSTITVLGDHAFAECDSLQTIIMPKAVDTFGENPFPSTTHVIVPKDITHTDWIFFWLNILGNEKKYEEIKNLIVSLKQHKTFQKGDWPSSLDYYDGMSDWFLGDTLNAISTLKKRVDQGELPFAKLDLANIYNSSQDYVNAHRYYSLAMLDSVPQAFNNLAYLYANGYGVQRNLKKAHQLVDIAIYLSDGNMNYYDSKGEFYLMEGDTTTARTYYDRVNKTDPDFYRDNGDASLLYKSLNKPINKSPIINSLEKKNELAYYVKLVQTVSNLLYSQQIGSIQRIEYEEIVSIGIIAMHVLIKGKSFEELSRYPWQYLTTSICWAIKNELALRYEWYSYAYFDNYFLHRSHVEDENNKRKIVEFVYRLNYSLKDYIPSVNISMNDDVVKTLKKDVETWNESIEKAIRNLEKTHPGVGNMMRDFFDPSLSLSQVSKLMENKKIEAAINAIAQSFTYDQKTGLFLKKNGKLDKEIYTKDDLNYLISIAKIAAKLIDNNQSNSSLKIDYEELLSIGVLAIQTWLHTMSRDDFSKYDWKYFSIVILRAIQNELSIRYNWYKQFYKNNTFMEDLLRLDELEEKERAFTVKLLILRTCYNLMEISSNLFGEETDNKTLVKLRNEINIYHEAVDEAIEKLDKKIKTAIVELLNSTLPTNQILSEYHLSKEYINPLFDIINDYLKSKKHN